MSTRRRFHALLCAALVVPLVAISVSLSSAASGSGALFTPLRGFRADAQASVRPTAFAAYRVDLAGVRDRLAGGGRRTIEVPDPTGTPVAFTVAEHSVMAPAMQAAHPEIRTYAGHAGDGSSVRLDVTPLGFHAFVRRADGIAWYVDPATDRAGEDRVLSYVGRAVPAAAEPFVERDLERAADRSRAAGEGFSTPGGIVSTRTYDLAFLSDPTYGAHFGNTDGLVLAAKTSLINRVDEVYHADLGIEFQLIAGTDTKLNLNAAEATAPDGPCGASACFTSGELAGCDGATLDRNEFVLGQLVGADNFDIGHIGLGVNGGGIAGVGVVGGPSKADGCTGLTTPDGDFYAIDYVAHEMGHQMGASHTFNGVNGFCNGNGSTSTAVEPGSGSSIMAYAGICGVDNLQPHSDPYFSFASLDQINATTAAFSGSVTEEQVVNLDTFDGTDSFKISCASCGTSGTIANGTSYTLGGLETAVEAATGLNVNVFPYDGDNALTTDGFTVDFPVAAGDVAMLTVLPDTGSFSTFTGTIRDGGPATNQGTVAATSNHAPVVTAPADKTLPIRTPFTLTGSATDADGGQVTYLWEQADAGVLGGTALPNNFKPIGPLFRQFGTAALVSTADSLTYHSPGENLAGTSPSRTFPDLAQVLAGTTNAATGFCPDASAPIPPAVVDCFSEFLPTAAYGSPMHFRLTARDVDAAGGGIAFDGVTLSVDRAAGPFLVTSRSGGGAAAGLEKVTWKVAGTDTAALAKNVRITLSTDGGLTYPTVLAGSTPNDGSQQVLLPDVTTSAARIKVEAVGNYFFDVNDATFSISPAPDLLLGKGKGTFTSPRGSSEAATDARGTARFSFKARSKGLPYGRAAFNFRAGHVAFTGKKITDASTKGRRLTLTVKGKAGYKLVIVAVDKGSRDRIRVRLLKGKQVVYDSMPGSKAKAKPRTKIKGHITVG